MNQYRIMCGAIIIIMDLSESSPRISVSDLLLEAVNIQYKMAGSTYLRKMLEQNAIRSHSLLNI